MNYGEIKAQFTYLANRSDANAAAAALLMPAVEQRINYGEAGAVPAVRVSAQLKSATTFTVPSDWLEMHRVMSGKYRMDFMPWQAFGEYSQLSGPPAFYSINNNTIALAPTGGADPIAYWYYAKFTSLSADSDTNWLSINAPNVYVSALLVEWARKSRDAELLAREAQNYSSSVLALMSADQAAQISGTTLRRSPGAMAYR